MIVERLLNEGKERAEVASMAEGTGRKREWPRAERASGCWEEELVMPNMAQSPGRAKGSEVPGE